MELAALELPGDASIWTGFGFEVDEQRSSAGHVMLVLGFDALGWNWRGHARASERKHPNTVTKVDHVVLFVHSLNETLEQFECDYELKASKRSRPRPDGPEMAWIRAGEPLIEIVQQGDVDALWGVTFRVSDMSRCADVLGSERLGAARPAIQGGLIATARGTPFPLAFREK